MRGKGLGLRKSNRTYIRHVMTIITTDMFEEESLKGSPKMLDVIGRV